MIMITKSQLKKVEEFAEKEYSDLNWMHVCGIRKIAKIISEKENADSSIVELAVLFHDIAKKDFKREIYHHIEGSKVAEKFLSEIGVGNATIGKVCHCVISHSTPLEYFKEKARKLNLPKSFLPEPKTIEAKVLFDSDMLQQLSPYGITKSLYMNYTTYNFGFVEGFKKTGNTLVNDACKALFTKTAREMAKERIAFLKKFFGWLERCD